MARYAPLDIPENGKLAQNIIWFARALRKAGLKAGPARTLDAIRAVEAAGFTERADFYWTLHACFVSRPEDRAVFAQVFRLFWRDPRYLEHMMALLLPTVQGVQEDEAARPASKRAAEALLDGAGRDLPPPPENEETEIEIDASRTASAEERLRTLDFEQMSTDEMAAAKRMLARLTLPVPPTPSRRSIAATRGAVIDARATLRAAARAGGALTKLARRDRRIRWPNLVVICDISGSMSAHSRAVLHFIHAVANEKGAGWARVHAFTFGTRLTNITRHLARRDVDAALAAAGAEAQDWQGGTRIGDALHVFNRDWSRRVLGSDAVVLLITDGLDRGDAAVLSHEAERLSKSCKRLIWLNPLLRWDGFAPKAAGIRALMPHVDAFRAGHNIDSIEALGAALRRLEDGGDKARMLRLMAAEE